MADEDNSMFSWIKGLFGGPSPAAANTSNIHLADPRKQYPTDEDVDFARKNDYSYGQPWAPEFENRSARILDNSPNANPWKSQALGTDKKPIYDLVPGKTDPLKNLYAKAALASEGSALAKLGFDPDKAAVDLFTPIERANIVGAYRHKSDQIYANPLTPSSIVHESIHRGIEKLRDTPFWKKEYEPDDEEMLVRHLMQTKMGDPEKGEDEAVAKIKNVPVMLGQEQQSMARALFNPQGDSRARLRQRHLDDMEAAAANAVAAKRPGGPR